MALSIGIQIRLERLDPEALASAAADATPYIVLDQHNVANDRATTPTFP